MTKKEKILRAAEEIVGKYSATMIPDYAARIKRGTFKHLDGTEEKGHWVTCFVFIPEDYLKNE
jgi:hypothetical protein